MQLLSDQKPYLILLSHRDKDQEKYIFDLIKEKLKNVEIEIFHTKEDLKNRRCDLIMVDTDFDSDRFECVKKQLEEFHSEETPYLIFIPADIDGNKINELTNFGNVVDFLREPICTEYLLLNRIKILLTIPKICRENDFEQTLVQQHIWKLLDYSNFFVVILDKDLNIKLCNYHLARTLGYENETTMLGLNWIKFLTPYDKTLVSHVHNEILNKSNLYREYSNDIIDREGKPITVKWFNSLINGEFNCTFSIGIPLTKEPTLDQDIDAIRSYFRDILDKDKTTINAIREVTTKYSNKMFGEK